MPGATAPLDIVRLAGAEPDFVILGRFPAGFERVVPGGYRAAEEFLVLEGELELEAAVAGRGSLCFVPAHHVRAPMRSPGGCTVLAWFSGPAVFRSPDELSPPPASQLHVLDVRQLGPGDGACTAEAVWTVADRPPAEGWSDPVDVVDLALTRWTRVLAGQVPGLPEGPLLVRSRLDGAVPCPS